MRHTSNTLSWNTTEYKHQLKSAEWFWAFGIISTAGAFASILVGNILFAILIIIGSVSITIFAIRKPAKIKVILTKQGVLVESRLHPYSTLESFCILYEERPTVLKIEMKNPIMPYISIQIETISPDDVHIFLSKFLEEKNIESSIYEGVMEMLGF